MCTRPAHRRAAWLSGFMRKSLQGRSTPQVPSGLPRTFASAVRCGAQSACNEADAYLLCGNPAATKPLRMKCSRRIPLTIGGVDVRLLHYHVLPPRAPGVEPLHARSVSARESAHMQDTESSELSW